MEKMLKMKTKISVIVGALGMKTLKKSLEKCLDKCSSHVKKNFVNMMLVIWELEKYHEMYP